MKRALWLGLIAAAGAQAHVRQRIYFEGLESILAWPAGASIKISMHGFSGTLGTSTTATSIAFASAQSLAGESLAQWSGGGSGLLGGLFPDFTFDLDTGDVPYSTTSACETTTGGDIDQVNNLVFTSKINTACAGSLETTSGVIGLTKVAYQPSSGEIVEADIQFDDREFKFKTTGTNSLTTSPKEIILKDVMTHEMGHLLGLDHSSSRDSSMLFAIAENLKTTKTDDQAGLLSLYPPTNLDSLAGTAQGSLMSSGDPVFGAAVFFLNARTLQVDASEMSDVNGAFEFCALPPGPKVAFAAAYLPYGTNIHEYYSGDGEGSAESGESCVNPACEVMTTALKRSWYSKTPTGDGGGLALKRILVEAGSTAKYVNIAGAMSETALTPIVSATALALDEPRVARLSQSTIPLNGTTTSVGTDNYVIEAPSSGNVQIRTASLRLYARVKLNLQLFDGAGTDVTASACPVSAGHGEAFDEPSTIAPTTDIANAHDPWLECTGLTAGASYRVRVTGTGVSCASIPGNKLTCESLGFESSSTDVPYYILTAFETSKLDDIDGGETLSSSSRASTTWKRLPTCGAKSATPTKSDASSDTKGGACCGSLGGVPGGPSGPASLLLATLLSPVLWLWGWRLARRARGRFTAAR